jgi:hypothetical protein
MNRWLWCVFSGLLFAGEMSILVVETGIAAERSSSATCALELKRLEPISRGQTTRPADYVCRTTSSQHFIMQFLDKEREKDDPRLQDFRRIVKEEPKYESDQPFRGVAKLGGKQYAFVLDKKDATSKAYNRLYFDANGDGDLTDDKPIDGEQERVASTSSYSTCEFPQVSVRLDIDGTKTDYAFSMRCYARTSGDFKYASVSLTAGAYREGEITLEGKKHHVVLLDGNGNGQFDDPMKLREIMSGSESRIYPEYGDVLLVDPDPNASARAYEPNINRHWVAKIVNIDGRYYDMQISPAGDKLTLTPSAAPLGYVSSPHEGFRAVLFGDQGVVNIDCGMSKAATVPAGTWKVLSYSIDQTDYSEPPKPAEKDQEKSAVKSAMENERSPQGTPVESLVGSEAASVVDRGPRYTMVSANVTQQRLAVKVGPGETVKLSYGPPFKPVVKALVAAKEKEGPREVRLLMSLIGAAGESCSNLMVDGAKPPSPKFTITTAQGDVVETGTFKYG